MDTLPNNNKHVVSGGRVSSISVVMHALQRIQCRRLQRRRSMIWQVTTPTDLFL